MVPFHKQLTMLYMYKNKSGEFLLKFSCMRKLNQSLYKLLKLNQYQLLGYNLFKARPT